MDTFLKFLLSKGKKSLWLLIVGLLAISSVNAVADVLNVSGTETSAYDFNGTKNSLNISPNGSVIVDNNYTAVHTNELNDNFITNYGTVSTTVESNSSDAYGIYIDNDVANSSITNDGNITAHAESNDDWTRAYGIYVEDEITFSNIRNRQTIIATAVDNDSAVGTYGIFANYDIKNSNIINDGNITATADSNSSSSDAYGIMIDGDVTNSNITNDGNIAVKAKGNGYGAQVDGIMIDGDVTNSNITNGGNITAKVKDNVNSSYAHGIYIYYVVNNSNITNDGNVTATADSNGNTAYAYGIYVEDEITDSNITNDGNIYTTAKSNSLWAEAYGIYAYYDVTDSNITNDGNVTATADSNGNTAYAYGIYTDSLDNSSIINDGNVTAKVESNDSHGSDAYAYGIYANSLDNSSIVNSGTITAKVESNDSGAKVDGIKIEGDVTNSNIINNGNVTATADLSSSNAYAYGIFTGSDVYNSSIINDGNVTAKIKGNGDAVYAYGIFTTYRANYSNITNSENIITTAESNDSSANAYGIYIGTHVDYSNITNSENIITTAESNSSSAESYGIYTNYVVDSNITNSGTITAKINNKLDKKGYSIHVSGSDSNSIITNTKTGKLYGNIHIGGDAKVTNKGLIALPYNANNAYIGGDLDNSGTLQIAMLTDGNISNTKYSQLEVGGTATFNAGSVLDVNVLTASTNTKLLIGEQLKNVVSADTNLIVNDLNVTDNSALLDFKYLKNDNNISLDIIQAETITDATTTDNGSNSNISGRNPNAIAAAKALDKIQDESIPNSMDIFYTKLNTLSTDEAVAKAVDSTVPYTTISNIDISNAIVNNVFGVVENQGFGGLNSGDKLFREKRVWIKPFGTFGKQEDRDNIHGFDFNSQGLGIGAQGEYSDNAYAGIGLFYNKANVNVNGVDQSSDLNIYTALIYGQTPIAHGKVKLRYKASASWQDTDSNRYIALTNETAKANYTSRLYALDVKALKDFQMNDKLLLEPLAGATYKYIHTPSYTESGSSTNLSTDSSNTKRLTTYLGTKAYYQLNETSTLNAKISLGYDVTHDDIATISAYSAAPNDKFTTRGIDNGRWSYLASVGYKKQITNQDDINFRYEYHGEGSSYHNNAVSFNYLHKF